MIERYDSEASKEEIFIQAGLSVSLWIRNIMWLARHARAKRDLKAMSTWGKTVGEAIKVLKADAGEGEKGATIIIQGGEVQEPKEEKKRAQVVSIASAEPSDK